MGKRRKSGGVCSSESRKLLESIQPIKLSHEDSKRALNERKRLSERMQFVLVEKSVQSIDPTVSTSQFLALEIEHEMLHYLLTRGECVVHRTRAARRHAVEAIFEVAERVISLLLDCDFKFVASAA
jgi:hypothetical protein